LKIGKIKYLNCLPYYAGWEAGAAYQFESGTPAELNQKMRTGLIDAAPISSMEYLQSPQTYRLLPDLGIASRGLVRSVTLFSKKKIEELGGAEIAVTEESLTSTHLLKLLLEEKYGLQTRLIPMSSNPNVMLEKHDAALLIGDAALFAHPKKWIFRYDLGELWWQWQKQPFVFAVWALRADIAAAGENAQDFYPVLKERFLYNREHLAECIQKHGAIDEFDPSYPKIFGYLNGLSYVLEESHWQGLKTFGELCAARGWCDSLKLNLITQTAETSSAAGTL
jgi:chorismate dehydratase